MHTAHYLRFVVVLIAGLWPGSLSAQNTGERIESSSADATVEANAPTGDAIVQTMGEQNSQPPQYVGALNGTGLISMDTIEEHLLLSATVGGGWDSNPNDTVDGTSSGVYTFSPYIGLQGTSPKARYIVQYQPSRFGYSSDSYSSQTLHRLSSSASGDLNERWRWGLNAFASYGPNGARFLAPQQTVAVGEVPGTGVSSASYLSNAGNVTFVAGSAELSYRKSERDTLVVSGSNSFSRVSGFNQQGGVAGAIFTYVRDLSPTLSATGYGQAMHYYGDLNCESFGVGAGIRWRPRENAVLSLRGGPQISTQVLDSQRMGFTYSTSFTARMSRKSQLYVLSDYLPTVSYLGPGLWRRSSSAGYQYQVTRIGEVGADAGYVSSDQLTAVSSYRGAFWGINYGFRLHHGIAVSYSYRGYATDSGGTSSNRNVAQFSVTWMRGAGKIFQ